MALPSPLRHRSATPPTAQAGAEGGRAADLSTAARLLDLAIPLVRRHAGERACCTSDNAPPPTGFLAEVAAAREDLARRGRSLAGTPRQLFDAACFVASQAMAAGHADASGLRETLAELAALAWMWHDALSQDGGGRG